MIAVSLGNTIHTHIQLLVWYYICIFTKLNESLLSLCLPGVNSKSARVLLMLVIPGHLVFLYAISLLQGEEAPITIAFTICYLCAALLQVHWCSSIHAFCEMFIHCSIFSAKRVANSEWLLNELTGPQLALRFHMSVWYKPVITRYILIKMAAAFPLPNCEMTCARYWWFSSLMR